MNESEYDALMKKALFDDDYWAQMTATLEEQDEAAEWLRQTAQQVRADLKRRKALWAATPFPRHSPKWYGAGKEYQKWRASALGFEQALVRRMFDLGLNEQGHPIKRPKGVARPVDEAVARARSHAAYLEGQHKHVTRSLVALAQAVESFAAGDMTPRDLDAHLDELTVPDRGSETKTVRQLIAAIAAAYEESA